MQPPGNHCFFLVKRRLLSCFYSSVTEPLATVSNCNHSVNLRPFTPQILSSLVEVSSSELHLFKLEQHEVFISA